MFRVPCFAIYFCNLVAFSLGFSKFSASSNLSFLFSDFRQLFRTSFLFSFLFMFLVFSFLNFFDTILKRLTFFHLFSEVLSKNFNSLSFCNWPWFSSSMHCFSKDAVSCKQEILSDDALRSLLSKESLLSNVSDALSPALLPAAKSVNTGEKGELRKSLVQLSFLLLFLFYSFWHTFC